MKKRIAYTGYIVIVTVFFLYYLFPGDAVTSYINYRVNKRSPELKLSIKDLKPEFPPGIKLISTNLMRNNKAVIGANYLDIQPSYLSLFSSEKKFAITGDLYKGNLDSTIQISNITKDPSIDINASFKGIQIDQIPAISNLEAYHVTGVAAGNVIYGNTEEKGGKGNADITVTDSTIKFSPALFGIEQLSFKTIAADFDILKQRVTLKKLAIDSRDVSGSATGTIIIRNPLPRSTINIRGEIKPHPAFLKQLSNSIPVDMITRRKSQTGGIPFRITGSIERPNFNLR